MARFTHDPSCAEPEIERIVVCKSIWFGCVLALVFLLFNYFLVGNIFLGLGLALMAGALAGVLRYPSIKDVYRKLEQNPPLFAGENIIMEGYATHNRSFEGECHGYLCLTDRKLHFRYYPFTAGLEDQILLEDIDRIETYAHYWLWPTGIRLVMSSGKKQKFTVQRWRGGWLEELFRAWMKAVHRKSATAAPGVRPGGEVAGR